MTGRLGSETDYDVKNYKLAMEPIMAKVSGGGAQITKCGRIFCGKTPEEAFEKVQKFEEALIEEAFKHYIDYLREAQGGIGAENSEADRREVEWTINVDGESVVETVDLLYRVPNLGDPATPKPKWTTDCDDFK